MPAILRSPPGKILPNKECMPSNELEKTECYHGFLRALLKNGLASDEVA
jgi:hypothetical protein